MVRRRSLLDVLPFAIMTVLAILYLAEWRRSKVELQERAMRMDETSNALRRWMEVQSLKLTSLARGIRGELQELERMVAAASTRVDSGHGADVERDDAPAGAVEEETEDMQADLPPLPEDIHDAVAFVRGLDPAKFFADPKRNPSGRDFSGTERIRLSSEVAIARNQIDILEKEIQMICAENMDRMREEGDYVEYASGERPAPGGPGVVSFGEMTEHETTRIFYFYPEEFEEIYARKAEQRAIGENLVRRLLLRARD